MAIADEELAEQQSSVDRIKAPSRLRVVAGRFLRSARGGSASLVLVLLFLLAFVGPYLTRWTYTDKDFTAFLAPAVGRATGSAPCRPAPTSTRSTLRGLQKSLIIGLLVALVVHRARRRRRAPSPATSAAGPTGR